MMGNCGSMLNSLISSAVIFAALFGLLIITPPVVGGDALGL